MLGEAKDLKPISLSVEWNHPQVYPEIAASPLPRGFRSTGAELLLRGNGGRIELLFGEWAELGEQMIFFEGLPATACRRVELRVRPERRT